MPRRKQVLADKLGSTTEVPGWRDVVSKDQPAIPPSPTTGEGLARKTYLLTPRLIERLNALAEREQVGINELARHLFSYALDEVEAGRHTLPTKSEVRRRIVDR